MFAGYARLLQSPRGVWIIAAIGLCLALPSLSIGLSTDDQLHARLASDGDLALDAFHLQDVSHQRDVGRFSWWSNPNLSLRFLRPLSVLSMNADFTLFARVPWLMHLESALLYAALVALAWLLYRAILPSSPLTAALAALLFALDASHASAVGWLSSRSTVLASLFALAAVLLFQRSRAHSSRAWRVAAVSCVALSLAAAEAGVAVFVYLGAYVLAFEQGPLWKRVATLWPELVVFVAWAALYVSGGYGAHGLSFYRDVSETLREGPLDLPIWLFSLLGPSVISGLMIVPPGPARVATLLLVLPLIAALLRVLPRTRENFFFTLGALGCVATTFATVPQERLTICASFGAFGLIASFLVLASEHVSRFVRAMRWVLITFHLVLAPFLFVALLDGGRPVDRAVSSLMAAVPVPGPAEVIVLNLPIETISIFAHNQLELRDSSRHPTFHQLYAGAAQVVLQRLDERTLELHVEGGWARRPIEGMFASLAAMPPLGATETIGSMAITVRETEPDGRPRRVEFRFPDALDSPQRLWLEWRGTEPRPWTPPPVGASQTLEQLSMVRSLRR